LIHPSWLASNLAAVDLPLPMNPVRHTSLRGRISLLIWFDAFCAA
jgi:hypothetical protein